MTNSIKNLMIRFRSCDEGATLVEYGIALTLAIALGGGALLTLSNDVGDTYSDASAALKGEAASSSE